MAAAIASIAPPSSALQGQKAIIAGAAAKYGIDPKILWGVYGTESGYGKNTGPSSAGAVGPFQFEPGTAKGLGVNPFDFKSAAFGAANYLSQYKGRGIEGMLSAYNAGPAGALQPGYTSSVLKDAQSYGGTPTGGLPQMPAPKATGLPGSPTQLPGTSTRDAITSALLASGGKGLSASALLGAIRQPAASPVPSASVTATALPSGTAGVGDAKAGATPMPSSAYSQLIAEANKINGAHSNYEWGGGHNPTFAPTTGSGHGSGPGVGYDCSGAISALLHAAGKLGQPLVAQQFMSYGQPGPGSKSDLTIYASPTHVFAEINGRFFGTSMANPGGGAGWFQQAATAGYVVRHVSLANAPSMHVNQQTGSIIPYVKQG